MQPPEKGRQKQAELIARMAARGFVGVPELATLLQISRTAASQLCENGDIGAIMVGSRWRVYLDEVERFMKKGNRSCDPDFTQADTSEGI